RGRKSVLPCVVACERLPAPVPLGAVELDRDLHVGVDEVGTGKPDAVFVPNDGLPLRPGKARGLEQPSRRVLATTARRSLADAFVQQLAEDPGTARGTDAIECFETAFDGDDV